VERAASDERNFVKKAVNMALRAIGKRSPALHAAAVVVAKRLATSPASAARWVEKDALRELTSTAVARRLATRHRRVTTESKPGCNGQSRQGGHPRAVRVRSQGPARGAGPDA
jgi:hypothetical protein